MPHLLYGLHPPLCYFLSQRAHIPHPAKQYYPPNVNRSRCCFQPLCTECFVQLRRSEPTPTHLVSEPACCPFCQQENFGVTYAPPPWRTGIGTETVVSHAVFLRFMRISQVSLIISHRHLHHDLLLVTETMAIPQTTVMGAG